MISSSKDIRMEIMKATFLPTALLMFPLLGPLFGESIKNEDPGADFQKTVDAAAGLISHLAVPYHLFDEKANKTGGEFDPMSLFSVLQNLSLPEDERLDYVYQFQASAGYPILYVRKSRQKPYANLAEFLKSPHNSSAGRDESFKNILEALVVRDTERGFFEYAVFYFTADNFYLYKWAYTDRRVICSRDAREKIFSDDARIPEDVRSKARDIDLTPRIKLLPDQAEIRLVTFTAWGGFFEERLAVSRAFPHTLLSHDSKNLVAWDCGIVF